VTTVLLGALARNLDLVALRSLFLRVPVWFYLTSLAVVLVGQVAYAWRWRLLLEAAGVSVPFTKIVRQYFVGIFVNNFLPSTVGGDVAKVYYLGRDYGRLVVLASVAIDRLLGVGLLALLAVTALAVIPVSVPRLTAAQLACGAIALAAAVVLVLTGVGTGGLAVRVAWMGVRAVTLAERMQRLRLEMAAPLRQPAVIAKAAVVVVGYAFAVSVLYARFVAQHSNAVPPLLAMFAILSATTVLSNVPISLNGLGLREQLHVSLLAPIGIAPEVAVAMSLLLYAHLVIASLIGLVFWLQQPRASRGVPGAT